jgi:predicted AlkP superfamily phosphohydrolase/phosphomutase
MDKTLVVGWDAAGWDYLSPLLDSGRLPTLQGLINRGVHGVLASTIPPVTPVAWTSFITGKNPGKHGIFGWQWRRPGTWQFLPFSASQRVGSPWWKYLNDAGLRVGLVNIPMTYPPQPLDGFIVCDFGAPPSSKDLTYPQALHAELEKEFGWQGGVWPVDNLPSGAQDRWLFEAQTVKQDQLVQITLYLAKKCDVDVLAIDLLLLDHCNHRLRDQALLAGAIEQCDRDLAALIQGFQPGDVMLFSDHGARRLHGAFHLEHWLYDHGYLAWKRRDHISKDHLNWLLLSLFQQQLGWSGKPERWARKLALETLWLLPSALGKRLWAVIGKRVPRLMLQQSYESRTDFSRTSVHAADCGALYLNVNGRDPQGIVPDTGQEQLLDQLIRQLLFLTDPDTGVPLFSAAYRPHEIYEGPFARFAPDLALDFWSSRWSLARGMLPDLHPHSGYFVPPQLWYGDHTRDGIFCFVGEAYRTDDRVQTASIADVPAALLYRYGLPVPEDWDGALPLDLFDAGFVEKHPVTAQPGDVINFQAQEPGYSDQEAAEISARLSALGYLD